MAINVGIVIIRWRNCTIQTDIRGNFVFVILIIFISVNMEIIVRLLTAKKKSRLNCSITLGKMNNSTCTNTKPCFVRTFTHTTETNVFTPTIHKTLEEIQRLTNTTQSNAKTGLKVKSTATKKELVPSK